MKMIDCHNKTTVKIQPIGYSESLTTIQSICFIQRKRKKKKPSLNNHKFLFF